MTGDLTESEVQAIESLLIEETSFDYANMLNQNRNGSLVVAGDAVLFLTCEDPTSVVQLANACEAQNQNVYLVSVDYQRGQLILSGTPESLRSLQARFSNE